MDRGTPGQGAQGGTLRPPPAVLRVTKGWRKLGRGTVNSGVHTLSLLPKKQSPWFNPIEPKWIHGKRKVVVPDGLPTAYELAGRGCVLPSIVCEAVGVSRSTLYRHPKPDGSPYIPQTVLPTGWSLRPFP